MAKNCQGVVLLFARAILLRPILTEERCIAHGGTIRVRFRRRKRCRTTFERGRVPLSARGRYRPSSTWQFDHNHAVKLLFLEMES
ncbi:hypothetical protein LXA43DRAFT_367900 [Ganoderma leucocontextum]|nr:hypothetical protein LXA43DRAFT_367900 [Ganoderma leucocontextum]